jgi:UDP-N-acetylglucosamine acyltransferase
LAIDIHPTAVVSSGAVLHEGVKVGPYAVVEPGVEIGEGCVIEAHSIVHSGTTLGRECFVGPHALLGGAPQDVGYTGFTSYLRIGDKNIIREFVSIHKASKEGETTTVGNENFIMSYSHIGHDCQIGNGIVITSYVGISGHVHVEDKAVIGGQVGIHQFVRVGTMAMLGGNSAFNKDVPPYTLASGRPGQVVGLNVVGLRRNGLSPKVRRALSQAFRLLYRSGLNVSQAKERIVQEVEPYPEVVHLVEFLNSSERGICTFGRVKREGCGYE